MATLASIESTEPAQLQDLPTIVFIQGSFQIPEVYSKLTRGLEAQGYPTIHPLLPSCSNVDSDNFPQLSLVDDALAIRTELIRQIEYEGKTIVLACTPTAGGVIHFFLYSAFLLEEGQSVLSAFGESPNNDVKSDGRFYFRNGDQKLYDDLPPSEASLWASRLIAQSYRVQTTKLTRAAWRYIPSTYLVCENDHAVPLEYQEMFAEMAKAKVERCSSGHSPHLSQPEMLVQKIHKASQKAVAEMVKPKYNY